MIVATMASLSTRGHQLEQTVSSLLPQVDALCVYLNGHDDVPKCLRHPKVLHAVLSKEAGWRGAEAKLWFWDRDEFKAAPYWRDDDIAIVVDDDIIYPSNYVATLARAVRSRPRSIACVHGSILMEPFESYLHSRWVARARGPLQHDSRVHVPGTGTMAFRCGDFEISLRRDVTWSHCVDVMAAIAAKTQGLEVWSVARKDMWLHPLALPRGTSIFKQRVGGGIADVETQRLLEAGPWPALSPACPGFEARMPKRTRSAPKANVNAMLPPEVATWLSARLQGTTGAVVELGSGHGSHRLASMLPPGCRLVSVEHDSKFLHLISATNYVHAPIKNGWYDFSLIEKALPAPDQIVALVVDGPPKAIGRTGLLAHLDRFGTGPIVIDDVHRDTERKLANEIATRRGSHAVIHRVGDRAFATIG